MVKLLVRGRFEGIDLTPLRVHARHYMFYGAILACGIHRLENVQDSPAILRVEHVLQFGQLAHTSGERFLGSRLVFGPEVERVFRIDVLETEVASVRYLEGLCKIPSPLDEIV